MIYDLRSTIYPPNDKQNRVESLLSLAPGFSQVSNEPMMKSRFSGFIHGKKPLKRLSIFHDLLTGLKPGDNEIAAK
jgi:hypothetical protein